MKEQREIIKMPEFNPESFTKYETARLIGARALQIAMNAPLLIKITEEDLEKIKYDALKIAEVEFKSGILPITVHKPFPKKKEEALKKVVERKVTDKEKEDMEATEEEEIAKEGEIMELANPDDETDSDTSGGDSEDEA